MLRRILIGLVALLLIGALVIVVVIRQIVFGGTPTIHRSATEPVAAASPFATIDAPAGYARFVSSHTHRMPPMRRIFLSRGRQSRAPLRVSRAMSAANSCSLQMIIPPLSP